LHSVDFSPHSYDHFKPSQGSCTLPLIPNLIQPFEDPKTARMNEKLKLQRSRSPVYSKFLYIVIKIFKHDGILHGSKCIIHIFC
jgi:hypothetical protein